MNNGFPSILEFEVNGEKMSLKGMFYPPEKNTTIVEIPFLSTSTYKLNQEFTNAKFSFCEKSIDIPWFSEWVRKTYTMHPRYDYRKNILATYFQNKEIIFKTFLKNAYISSCNIRTEINNYNIGYYDFFNIAITREVLFEKTDNEIKFYQIEVEFLADSFETTF